MSQPGPPDGVEQTSSTRDAARQRAQNLRDEAQRREKRNRWILVGSVLIGAIAVVVAVAAIVTASIKPSVSDPRNFSDGGITVGADLKAVTAATAPVASSDNAAESDASTMSVAPVHIEVTMDYLCDACQQFFAANADQLERWVSGGSALLTVRPLAIVSTQNSLAAANAAACVANYDPDSFFEFNQAMFDVGSVAELARDDAGLKQVADTAVASAAASRVDDCIDGHRFSSWAMRNSEHNLNGATASPDADGTTSLPVITVNGQPYTGVAADSQAFGNLVLSLAGAVESSPSAEPTVP